MYILVRLADVFHNIKVKINGHARSFFGLIHNELKVNEATFLGLLMHILITLSTLYIVQHDSKIRNGMGSKPSE